MSQFIVRFTVELTALDQEFPLVVPASATDVALRVLCRYLPNETPPPPKVMIVTTMEMPDPTPQDTVIRNFMLVAVDTALPPDFIKYIGQVPFGPDKQLINIVETATITRHAEKEA